MKKLIVITAIILSGMVLKAQETFFPTKEGTVLVYKTFDKNYNRPELVNGKVNISAIEMRDFLRTEEKKVAFDKNVDVDALSGATWIKQNKK